MPHWRWILTQITRLLWVRATLIGLLGVAAAILATVVDRFIPWKLPTHISVEAVESILTIIASSMLAVTTFSLSVMTAAFSAATSNVTPRATRLLMEDRLTQNVLATFIGSFLFSMVGIVVLNTGAYGDRGRFILFAVTVAVIVLVVVALLRWIDHLIRLGRVGETTERVEQTARQAITDRLQEPYLGGMPLHDPERDIPHDAQPALAGATGYVQYIDMPALGHCCKHHECEIFVTALPGAFVYPDTPLAWIHPQPAATDAEAREAILHSTLHAFTMGHERIFDQDPRFGLAVMCEIGSRALSPATNDPGTAIDVISRMTRLMCLLADGCDIAAPEPEHPRVHVPSLQAQDLFEDAFMLIARDGAHLIEIQLRLQKTLRALSRMGDAAFRQAALQQAELAVQRAEIGLELEADKIRLRNLIHAEDRPHTRNAHPG